MCIFVDYAVDMSVLVAVVVFALCVCPPPPHTPLFRGCWCTRCRCCCTGGFITIVVCGIAITIGVILLPLLICAYFFFLLFLSLLRV